MKSSWSATSSYALLTIGMTWPLARGVASDVPGDLGDSLLNMWILGWGAEHLPRIAAGRMSLAGFGNANIFHPEPLALAFSEHLTGQALQILPVYHLTGNLILAYNLLFLSSFVLSGLGMYLLVRDVLSDGRADPRAIAWAAFAAGAIYAFVPFRIAQVAHIQSLSSQWMPLALYGFRRFVVSRRFAPLAGGTGALLMQNWSCGYYLVYFTPLAALFVLHQVAAAGRARDLRVWTGLLVAGAIVGAGTLPFLLLYLEGQRVHAIERPLGEVIRFSADIYSYFSAPDALRVWGGVMQAYPKREGELFFGLVPMLLTLTAAATLFARARAPGARFGALAWLLLIVIAVQFAGFVGILLTGGFITSIAGVPIRATNGVRILWGLALAATALYAVSPRARSAVSVTARSPLTLALALAILAMWLSLGPLPQSRGRALTGLGLYGVLYEHVPGFDGLRVPARYAMIAAVFLSMAAGYGALAIVRRLARPALGGALLTAAVLVEAAFVPMPVNQTWGDGGVVPPPRVEPTSRAPAVYKALAELPGAGVVAELPFGDPAWELRSVYYSTVHWKPIVNGYSGAFPRGYLVRAARLQRIAQNPDAAWQTLREAGTTHVVVREAAYPEGEADAVHRWLTGRGATPIGRFGDDVLYALGPAD